MDISLLQLNSVWESPGANFRKVEKILAENPPKPGALLILPEMFATGFSLDLSKTCEGTAVGTDDFLKGLAEKHKIAVLAGTVRMGGDGLGRNEAVAFGPDGAQLTRYLKQRPFSGAGEEMAHERGYEGSVFTWGGMRMAPFICYDLRFPELFRGGAKGGAEAFVVIAAWPKQRIEHWAALLKARAIENQAYVIGVNRTGDEPSMSYCGRSLVVDPRGEVVIELGEDEQAAHATIDAKLPGEWREEFPAYRDFHRWG